jgi:hypothetical protein
MNARLFAITIVLLLVIFGCSYNPERDKDCPGCDLTGANLLLANLTGAYLDGVIGADFSDGVGVPPEYLNPLASFNTSRLCKSSTFLTDFGPRRILSNYISQVDSAGISRVCRQGSAST